MSGHLAFSLLTLFPLLVLVISGGISIRGIARIETYRLLLLPAILVLMAQHQVLEVWSFFRGSGVAFGASEFIETGANILASVAVYHGVYFAREKQLLAEELVESEQRYRTLTEQSPYPILVVQDTTIVFANRAAGSTFGGGDPNELIGRSLSSLVHPSDETSPETLARTEQNIHTTEQRWYDLDDEEHTVVVSSGHATYRGEKSTYLLCQDVTEREAYRESFERTKSQLETALENSHDAVIIIDPQEQEILDANARAFEMLDYGREDLIGLSPYEIHPHETEQLDLFFEQILSDQEAITDELSCMRRDGEKIPVEISGSATEYGSRDVILAVVRDETERKNRQKQLDVLRRVLRHNLRNEMAVVIGHAERVVERAREDIADSGREIKSIANDLVAMSDTVRRIQDVIERDRLDPVQADVDTVVDTVATSVRKKYPDATIVTDVRPGVAVEGSGMLEQALGELAENAVEHNDNDEPWVEINAGKNTMRRGGWMEISVIDDGPGIPEHEREVIEMDAAETPLSHASGMGLWTASHVVSAVGGDMSIDDRPSGGSIVTLHLKTADDPDAEPVAA